VASTAVSCAKVVVVVSGEVRRCAVYFRHNNGPRTLSLGTANNHGICFCTVSLEDVEDQGRFLYAASDNTAYRGQFPWQVAIAIDDASFCSGSLISNLWVLTAAHCQ
jgi:hypothetical protein